jgi:dTDP-4-dehydrorhamnose reductase
MISETRRKKTVLIFGMSSFVGSNLAEYLKHDFKVVGTYHKTRVNIPNTLSIPCDVLSKDEVQMAVFSSRPDIAIYAAGFPSVAMCHEYDTVADALNTSGLINVTEMCERYKAKTCFISSSYVFGGEKKKFMEIDIPDSVTVYGKSLASSEFYIQKNSLNYIIFRTCPLIGRSFSYKRYNFFEKLQDRLSQNQKFICDNFVRHGFLDIYYLAAILKIAFQNDFANRLFQICTQDVMTHYQFAKTYCDVFGDDPNPIQSGKWPFPVIKTEDTDDISEDLYFQLDVSNVESFLKIKMPTIQESLEMLFRRYHGKSSRIGGGDSGGRVSFI